MSLDRFKKNISQKTSNGFLLEENVGGDTTSQNPFSNISTLPTLSAASKLLVEEALKRSKGNQSIAARLLGIT